MFQGNKGGVSIRFDLNGVNMIFVNSHLAAHMHNSAERIEVKSPSLETASHIKSFFFSSENFHIEILKQCLKLKF
jgi:hypothetical protein